MQHTAFSDTERYLFSEGSNAYAYRFMGAHPHTCEGRQGFIFRVWAPGAGAGGIPLRGFQPWLYAVSLTRLQGASGSFFFRYSLFSFYMYAILGKDGSFA
jgi:1,4-alpha-glucan branching enzyme